MSDVFPDPTAAVKDEVKSDQHIAPPPMPDNCDIADCKSVRLKILYRQYLHSSEHEVPEKIGSPKSEPSTKPELGESDKISPLSVDTSDAVNDAAPPPASSGSICRKCKQNTAETDAGDVLKWIQCDACAGWYHYNCVDMEEYEAPLIDSYHCPSCEPQHGHSILKKVVAPQRVRCDDPAEVGQPEEVGSQQFIQRFAQEEKLIPAPSRGVVVCEDGHDFTTKFAEQCGWTDVFLVRRKEGLGLQLPADDFYVDDLLNIVGASRKVDTIDVYRQTTYEMSLGRFHRLFTAPHRPNLYNILSLEFSNTELASIVQPPKFVRSISWVHKIWPSKDARDNDQTVYDMALKPEVLLFCLVGMANSYTDFHIDFGGSSVWYHIFKGEKVFYIAEPTEYNLRVYEEYQVTDRNKDFFLGDRLQDVSRVVIREGETLLIPSGWIHAVFTPKDSLVFGGNFLHSMNIDMQLKVYEMERRINVPDKFMYPNFEFCNWHAATWFLESIKDAILWKNTLDKYLYEGIKLLTPSLHKWAKRDKDLPTGNASLVFNGVQNKLEREMKKYELHSVCDSVREREEESEWQAGSADEEAAVDKEIEERERKAQERADRERRVVPKVRIVLRAPSKDERAEAEERAVNKAVREDVGVALPAMFGGRSASGRKRKPSQWVRDAAGHELDEAGTGEKEQADGLVSAADMEAADRIAEAEEREWKEQKQRKGGRKAAGADKTPEPRAKKKKESTAKQRLAARMGMARR